MKKLSLQYHKTDNSFFAINVFIGYRRFYAEEYNMINLIIQPTNFWVISKRGTKRNKKRSKESKCPQREVKEGRV